MAGRMFSFGIHRVCAPREKLIPMQIKAVGGWLGWSENCSRAAGPGWQGLVDAQTTSVSTDFS
jgi:hypothetical protein